MEFCRGVGNFEIYIYTKVKILKSVLKDSESALYAFAVMFVFELSFFFFIATSECTFKLF